jgi:hypothetical protein
MGDIRRIKLHDCWTTQPHSDQSAIRIDYRPGRSGGKGWSGMYWQTPENNWGNKRGGKDLRRFRAVTFYARGERGGERLVFLSGGIFGRQGDTLRRREIAVTLTREWRLYGIDLRGGDLRRVVGAFAWTATRAENPTGAIFYLDDIQFDTSQPDEPLLCAPTSTTVHYVLDGAHLCPSTSPPGRYEIGVDSSERQRRWLAQEGNALRMDYPGNQQWGAVFITVGDPAPSGKRPGENLSGCHTLQVDLRSPSRPTTLGIGMKDNTMPDDGSETKPAAPVARDWATASFPLRSFSDLKLTRVYVAIEFVFEAGSPRQQIYFRNVRFRC